MPFYPRVGSVSSGIAPRSPARLTLLERPRAEPDTQLADGLLDLDPLVEEEHAQRLPDTDMAALAVSMGDPAILLRIRRSAPMAGRLFSCGQTRRNLFPCLALRSAVRAPTLLRCCAPSVAVTLTRDGRSSNAGPGGRTAAAVCCPSARNVQTEFGHRVRLGGEGIAA